MCPNDQYFALKKNKNKKYIDDSWLALIKAFFILCSNYRTLWALNFNTRALKTEMRDQIIKVEPKRTTAKTFPCFIDITNSNNEVAFLGIILKS